MVKRLKLTIFIGLVLALTATFVSAEGTAGQPGEFIRWGVGARSLGMGRAYTSLASGTDAIIWNPSGLGGVEKWQASFMHSQLYANSRVNYLGFMLPVGEVGKFGVGWLNMGVNEFQGTDKYNISTGDFSFTNSAYFLAFGRWVWHNRFKVGLSTQLYQQKMADESAMGWGGINMGIISKSLFRKFKLAASVRNIGTPDLAGDKYELSIRTGLNYRAMRNLIVSADVDFMGERAITPRVGAEYRLGRSLTLRSGYDGKEITFGMGYRFGSLNLLGTELDLGGPKAQVNYAGGALNKLGNNFTRFSAKVSGEESYSLGEIVEAENPCENLSEYEPLLTKYNVVGAAANLIFGSCYFRHESKKANLEKDPSFSDPYRYFKAAYVGKFGDDWKEEIVTNEQAKKFFHQKTHYMYAESYMHKKGFTENTLQLIKDLIYAGGDSTQYDMRLQYDLALTHKVLGQIDSAKTVFNRITEEAAEESPIKILSYYQLAQILKDGSTSERQKAITYLERITNNYQFGFYDEKYNRLSYPMFPKFKDNNIVDDAHLLLGDIKFAQGGETNIKEALDAYLQVVLFFQDLSSENLKKAYQKASKCFENLGKKSLAEKMKTRVNNI